MDENLEKKIQEYYKLKQKYEDKIVRQKLRILRDDKFTVREKRQRVRLIKKQCVSCKKDGGTEFSRDNHVLRATCGNSTEPCDLNIEINRGDFEDIRIVKQGWMRQANKDKTEIIKTKLDLLFNYVNESQSLERFEKLRTKLRQYTKPLDIVNSSYLSIVNNVSNQKDIEALEADLFVINEELDGLAEQFRSDPQPGLVRDMVEIYMSRIDPVVTKLRRLKYEKSYIEKLGDDSFRLVEEPYTLENLLINLHGV